MSYKTKALKLSGAVPLHLQHGDSCYWCGAALAGGSFGRPRWCSRNCARLSGALSMAAARVDVAQAEKVPCPSCGRMISPQGLQAHIRDSLSCKNVAASKLRVAPTVRRNESSLAARAQDDDDFQVIEDF